MNLKHFKRWMISGAVCLGTMAFLCACGNGGAAESTETGESGETEASGSTTAAAESETETETEDTTVYAYEYDLESLVTLGEYKGLTYTAVDTSVSDDEVEEQLNNTVLAYAEPEQITNRAVEDGDTINLDYEGLLDGEAFDGGTAEGASLTIGSGNFIDGFEDGLIGVKPGDKKELNLTFPEDYPLNPDLAGKAVVFNVTVNYIEGDDVVPEMDDAFVESLGLEDVTTVDAYREYMKNQLQDQKESEAESSRQSELFQKAVDNAEIKELPQELVAQYTQEYADYYTSYASYFGMEMEDFLTQYLGQTEEEFNQDAEDYGKEVAGDMLVVCAIAKAEGIDPDALYDEKAAEFVEQSGYPDVESLEADYGRKYLKQVIINDGVIEILEANAVVAE